MEHYTDLKRIGRGNYGTVYKGKDQRNGRVYCLKQIIMESHSDNERKEAEQECDLLKTLDHPGIVRYHEHFMHEDSLWVVMAYCEQGDLGQHIKKRAKAEQYFTEDQVVDWFVQIAMALHYVHSRKILHRDVSCACTVCRPRSQEPQPRAPAWNPSCL